MFEALLHRDYYLHTDVERTDSIMWGCCYVFVSIRVADCLLTIDC